jgi:flagellar hook-length control protein FliK
MTPIVTISPLMPLPVTGGLAGVGASGAEFLAVMHAPAIVGAAIVGHVRIADDTETPDPIDVGQIAEGLSQSDVQLLVQLVPALLPVEVPPHQDAPEGGEAQSTHPAQPGHVRQAQSARAATDPAEAMGSVGTAQAAITPTPDLGSVPVRREDGSGALPPQRQKTSGGIGQDVPQLALRPDTSQPAYEARPALPIAPVDRGSAMAIGAFIAGPQTGVAEAGGPGRSVPDDTWFQPGVLHPPTSLQPPVMPQGQPKSVAPTTPYGAEDNGISVGKPSADVAPVAVARGPDTLVHDGAPSQPSVLLLQTPVVRQTEPTSVSLSLPYERITPEQQPPPPQPRPALVQVASPAQGLPDPESRPDHPSDAAPAPHQSVQPSPMPTAAERAFATRVTHHAPRQFAPSAAVVATPDVAPSSVIPLVTTDAQHSVSSTRPDQSAAEPVPATPTQPVPMVETQVVYARSPTERISQPAAEAVERPRLEAVIPVQALPQAIVEIARSESNATVQLRLDPVELGVVQVTMQGTDKDLTIVVMVERPETLDLLRKHADQFLADLRQSGFSGMSLTFSSSDHHGSAQRHAPPPQITPPDFHPQPAALQKPAPKVSGGLDMRL